MEARLKLDILDPNLALCFYSGSKHLVRMEVVRMKVVRMKVS